MNKLIKYIPSFLELIPYLFAIAFILLLASACSVTVPRVPICAELNPAKGYCVNTVTSEEFVIDETHLYDGKSWWQMRPEMMVIPAQSWAEIKAFIVKVCRKTKQCDTELGSWDRTVEAIDSKVVGKGKNGNL